MPNERDTSLPDETTSEDQPQSPSDRRQEGASPSSPGVGWWSWCRSRLGPRLIVGIVVATLAVQGLLSGWYRFAGAGTGEGGACPAGEITIGEFGFTASPHEVGPVTAARFQLHLALLPDIEPPARRRLDQRRFRVQQGVEQLMRRAHGGDFSDPTLSELKRQLQEQINRTLGIRAVADVIITDLELERSAAEDNPPERPAPPDHSPPWTPEG